MQPTYLLVLGAGRSGTTLLASMLGAHSEVAMLIEDAGWSIKNLTSKRIFANKLCVPSQLSLTGPSRIDLLLRRLRIYTGGTLCRFPFDKYLELQPLKMIQIIRDGNAVISSIQKRGGRKFDAACEQWRGAVEMMHVLLGRYPDTTHVVAYETLVKKPLEVMQAAAAFLELEYEEKMLQGYKYSPIYPGEKSIDANRAERHKREQIDYDLDRRFPEAMRQLRELEERCAVR